MKQYNKITPIGTKDRLFTECQHKRQFEEILRRLFESRGFLEVSTPVLEYYDVFEPSRAYFPQQRIYKLVDRTGRILVLRPDCTIPIARLVSTRLKNQQNPLRLYYSQNVYQNGGYDYSSSEISQIGVEYIGAGLPICDVEIVQLASKSLRLVCEDTFKLELCHIGYFNALINSLPASNEVREEIRSLVEKKNYPALNTILEQFSDSPAQKALKKLPSLFGEASVIDEARKMFSNKEADEALDYLAYIYNSLSQLGLANHLSIDLGLVTQADYYTGILFRGYTAGAAEPVLSGGRYDGLIGEFSDPRPATGFGINLDLLCQKVQGKPIEKAPSAAVLVDSNSDIKLTFETIEKLGDEDFSVELFTVENPEQATAKPDFDKTIAVAKDTIIEL